MFHGPESERTRLKSLPMADLIVTSYETYVSESGWFKTRRWGVCVLDEGCGNPSAFFVALGKGLTVNIYPRHKFKNSETILAKELQGI